MDDLDAEFSAFAQARTPALLRSARLLTGEQHTAEDLVQSALARTFLTWRRLHRAGNAEAYTRKIMYHLHVDPWRRRRIVEVLAGAGRVGGSHDTLRVPERVCPDHADRIIDKVALHAALMRLTLRQRAVLVLRFFEDRSELETAEVLDCSVGTVKSQTAKALARLRQHTSGYAPTAARRPGTLPADSQGVTR